MPTCPQMGAGWLAQNGVGMPEMPTYPLMGAGWLTQSTESKRCRPIPWWGPASYV